MAHLAESLSAGTAARARTEETIRAMMGSDQDYAGMVRYFVRVEWSLDV